MISNIQIIIHVHVGKAFSLKYSRFSILVSLRGFTFNKPANVHVKQLSQDSFQKLFFPKFEFPNFGCSDSASMAHPQMFTVTTGKSGNQIFLETPIRLNSHIK